MKEILKKLHSQSLLLAVAFAAAVLVLASCTQSQAAREVRSEYAKQTAQQASESAEAVRLLARELHES